MKKVVLSAAAALLVTAAAHAGTNALDVGSLQRLRMLRLEQKISAAKAPAARTLAARLAVGAEGRRYVGAFVSMQPGVTASDLEALGLHVMTQRGDIAVCMVAIDDVERIAADKGIRSMTLGRKARTQMDFARKAAHLDEVHAGEPDNSASPRAPYTGKGVALGVFDEGIDPGHVNFLNPDGTHRVAFLTHITDSSMDPGYKISGFSNEEYNDFTPISNFTTDSEDSYHGTHTLGIAGGAFRGDVTMADYSKFVDKDTKVPMMTAANPYYGAAPDATLVASCGTLVDEFIALGIDQMCSFALDKNKPLVISLSLGSNSGPHDVRSNMSRFLDLTMTESAGNPNPPIICISSGNEGDHKIALRKTLRSHDDVLRTMIWPYYMQYDPDVEGSVTLRQDDIAIFSADSTPLDVQAIIYNKERNYKEALRMPVVGDDIGTYYITDEYFQITESDVLSTQLAKNFQGFVGVGGAIEPETGRYYAMVDYGLQNSDENQNDTYLLGFEVRVREGAEIPEGGLVVEAYCSGQTTEMYNYRQETFDEGSRNGSISDMAVSPKLIVVGSYNSRQDWICLDGYRSSYVANDPDYFKPGYVSGFSSFGTLADGRNLPTVCAPGSSVISSVNRYYSRQLTNEQEIGVTFQAKYTDATGDIHYWKQEPGTSMACPFLAGTVACWLEADPTLKYDEVREIIEQTATVDDQVRAAEDPVQWGAGKFDALAGLKEVLRRKAAAIGSVAADPDSRLVVTPAGDNTYNIFVGESQTLDIRVYSAAGAEVLHTTADTDETTLSLGHLTPGVYVLTANNLPYRLIVK